MKRQIFPHFEPQMEHVLEQRTHYPALLIGQTLCILHLAQDSGLLLGMLLFALDSCVPRVLRPALNHFLPLFSFLAGMSYGPRRPY